jgi:putative RecB family exonuclease
MAISADQRTIKLTPSRTEDFLACPRRYKSLYIDQLAPKDVEPSKYLSFGISIHDALNRFYDGGGNHVYEQGDMNRLLAQSWVPAGYSSDEEAAAFYADGLKMLERYYDAFRAEPTQHLGHELFIQAKFRLESQAVILSGKIDRLSVWPDGRLNVVDYKTSAGTPPTPERLAAELAPFLYYLLGRINYSDYPQVDVTFLYLRSMTAVTARFDSRAIAQGKARLTQVVRQIGEGFFPPKPNGHCGWCEVRDSCPALCHEEVDLERIS